MHRRTGAVGGDAVARRVETGRARLAQRGNRGRRKPFGHPRCRGTAQENEKNRAHTRKRVRLFARASGMNLKVSRAVEKLAHLISNGSFNNISLAIYLPSRRRRGPLLNASGRLRRH